MAKITKTSWGGVADWYDNLIESEGTYQKEVILPNLLRVMAIKKGDRVLDLACGQGFFSREFFKVGAAVISCDIAPELVALAEKNSPKDIQYSVTSADNLSFLPSESLDAAAIVLALQNIENIAGVFSEVKRVLRPKGKFFIVLNHPAFRVPKSSSWGFDEKEKVQYRRIDRYLSESKEKISMHPGKSEEYTVSFHRPLQVYFKHFVKAGFSVTRLEEWISHKKSQQGPRGAAEDLSRKEIPLFLLLEVRKD